MVGNPILVKTKKFCHNSKPFSSIRLVSGQEASSSQDGKGYMHSFGSSICSSLFGILIKGYRLCGKPINHLALAINIVVLLSDREHKAN